MSSAELEAFLTHLAAKEQVAASTQNQALNAVLFLYREVLKQDLGIQIESVRAKRSRYLPTVLTQAEAITVIHQMSGVYQLVVKLLYGIGGEARLTYSSRRFLRELSNPSQYLERCYLVSGNLP